MNDRIPAELLSLYGSLPARVRAHIAVRWRTCPFPAVASRVPERGRILDFGCGHGSFSAWLARLSPAREVLGVDVARDKIAAAEAAAKEAARRGEPRPAFLRIAPGEVPEGPWDAVLFVDVLYLMDPADQEALLRRAARKLAPGGALFVKEVGNRPRGKALWNRMQETMAVRVFGITAGRRLRFLSPERHAGWLEEEGLEVERARLDRGYAHPHHLLVARRRPGLAPERSPA
jgi:2-polyprenyl-3-methyl-5-hydroxy-6-metoxy-1,4-benzoquinol methylase